MRAGRQLDPRGPVIASQLHDSRDRPGVYARIDFAPITGGDEDMRDCVSARPHTGRLDLGSIVKKEGRDGLITRRTLLVSSLQSRA